ncbi:hypothetical protein F5Y19DRAFT_210096 [Xylariaceae sp. FL1651]|nr:hypothetical protein F5Y19DRAFT_210096 [Xylariaceae sp. FL1651]
MAADPLPASLSFLTDAAHLLVSASPETSAYLMSQRNSLIFNNNLEQSDVQKQHVCGCCGHIMIAGQGDLLTMAAVKTTSKSRSSASRRKAKEAAPRTECRKTLTCGKCGRYTRINFPPPARISRHRSRQVSRPITTTVTGNDGTFSASTSLPVAASTESTKLSANASSKKRAKNRKQGLQALLEQSSSSKPQVGLGLSLADFMQK